MYASSALLRLAHGRYQPALEGSREGPIRIEILQVGVEEQVGKPGKVRQWLLLLECPSSGVNVDQEGTEIAIWKSDLSSICFALKIVG